MIEHKYGCISGFLPKIETVAAVHNKEYDCIAVAIKKEEAAQEAIDELINIYGIPQEKIVWGKSIAYSVGSMLATAYM